MTFDWLFIGVFACIGTAVILAYLLGHYRGMEAAFDEMRLPHGDVPQIPAHAMRLNDE